ncbi:UNVERIFIED_ORG: hypothetical protein GGD51_004502 [Rhizobium esperanzae]
MMSGEGLKIWILFYINQSGPCERRSHFWSPAPAGKGLTSV